jgi:hypothetical protein
MRAFMFFLATFLFVSFGYGAEKLMFTGEVVDKDGQKVYDYERHQETKGTQVHDRAVHKDLDGKVVTEEKMISQDGQIVRYDMDQRQLKQKAWIEVADGKVTFNLKKFRKNNYPQSYDLPANFMMGLQIVPFVQKNWEALSQGKDQKISLGVWHRQEAITFMLSKEEGAEGEMVVKMNPSSMFIRAVVDPIYFHFDTKTKELSKYRGRITPKQDRGGKLYDFDGTVTYKKM